MNAKYIHIGKSTILWEKASFTRVFKFLKNNSLSRAELSDGNGNVKNIHYGDILIKFSECLYTDEGNNIPYIINDNIAYKLLKLSPLINGDIVFSDAAEDNTVGKCVEIITHNGTDLVAGLHTIPCRPTIKFAEGYLGYYLNSTAFHNQLLQYIQGTKISSISKKSICQTIISYPSEIINQQKIVSYFQSLDSLIQTTSKKLVSLKQIKDASLQSMFPQEGETVPKVRFKGFEGEWEKIPFGSFLKESYERSTVENEDILLSSAITGVYLNSELFGHQRGASNIGYKKIKKNMLILSTQNLHLGNANVNLRFEHGLISPAYKVYEIVNISPLFLQQWIKMDSTNFFFLNATTAGASLCRKNIVWDDLYKQIVLIPSKNEQVKIGLFFSNLDKQISLQAQRLEKLKQIKAACLDKMFV